MTDAAGVGDLAGECRKLPRNRAALIEGVIRTAGGNGLNDDLDALAGDIAYLECILAERDTIVYRSLGSAVLGNACLSREEEAESVKGTDLALVNVIRICVLLIIDPVLVGHDVMGDAGMDDHCVMGAVDGGRILLAQEGGRLRDNLGRKLSVGGNACTRGYGRLASVISYNRRVDDVGAGAELVSYLLVHGKSRLLGMKIDELGNAKVDVSHRYKIGEGSERTELDDGHADLFLHRVAGVGGNAFLQYVGRLVRKEASPVDSLAGVFGNGFFFAELMVHKVRQRSLEHSLRIELGHAGSEIGRAGVCGGNRLRVVGEYEEAVFGNIVDSFHFYLLREDAVVLKGYLFTRLCLPNDSFGVFKRHIFY